MVMGKHKKKSKKAREPETCETCDSCIYVGEGDFICDRCKEPKFVIIGWIAEQEACEKWRER